jgi:transcriptional regulator with XRE-family HTH domain
MRDSNELLNSYKESLALSSDNKVADCLGVSRSMISQIRGGKMRASAAMRLRLLYGSGNIRSTEDLIEALMESLPEKTAEAVREILVHLGQPKDPLPALARCTLVKVN